MALDPSLAETNFSQAVYLFFFERTWPDCEKFLRRAISINPRMVDAPAYLGMTLACRGRVDEALEEARLVLDIDPLSPFSHFLAAAVFCLIERFDLMEEAARRVLDLQSDAMSGLWTLVVALCSLDRAAEAVPFAERAVLLSRAPFYLGQLGLVYARIGRHGDARRLVDELEDRASRGEYISPIAPLSINVGLGDEAGIRTALAACVADSVPFPSIGLACGGLLNAYRNTDPEISRLYEALKP